MAVIENDYKGFFAIVLIQNIFVFITKSMNMVVVLKRSLLYAYMYAND